MFDDFILRSLAAGISFSMVAGPMGCFVIWRRLAFFGDTLAHASLCGIALSLFMDINPLLSVLFICGLIGVLLTHFKSGHDLSSDTALAVISHGSLALGILTLSLFKGARFDLNAYLFGDILSVTSQEVGFILTGGLIILGVLMFIWPQLLSMTLAEDLAAVEGVAVRRINLIYMILLAVFVAFSLKMIGALLITALLILPASTAQSFAKSPEHMACLSSLMGIIMVTGGIFLSQLYDVPTTPAIVVVGIILFVCCRFKATLSKNS
ncbi:MAG: iron chelate uptake ABC transporter family permease subunit [Janthinobacterium lividum]